MYAKWVTMLLFLCMSFVPSVPDRLEWSTITFVALCFVLVYSASINISLRKGRLWRIDLLDTLIWFVPIYLILSALWAIIYSEVSPAETFRAFAPFTLLCMYMPFRYFLHKGMNVLDLLMATQISAVVTLLYSYFPLLDLPTVRTWSDIRMSLETGVFLPTLPAAVGIAIFAFIVKGMPYPLFWLTSSVLISIGR